METKTRTKGNIIVEEIKVGDIHYEFKYGLGIKSEVITMPIRNNDGYWSWESKNVNTGVIIEYGVSEKSQHYSSNLYDHIAYTVERWI